VVTNVHTDEALKGDNDALPAIHERLSKAALLPDRHLVDTGYVEAKRLVESRRDYGVDLYGPTPGNRFWQAEQRTGFDISHFVIDWERELIMCPEGKQSSNWTFAKRDSRISSNISEFPEYHTYVSAR
jgi:transposase